MSALSDSNSRPPIPRMKITEVKYSLPEMLEEIKAERSSASFAMEQLDQQEIGKLFKAKSRAKSKK